MSTTVLDCDGGSQGFVAERGDCGDGSDGPRPRLAGASRRSLVAVTVSRSEPCLQSFFVDRMSAGLWVQLIV